MPSFPELTLYVLLIFTLNVIPAFAPPTWMALSWIGFEHPQYNPFLVALIGATAATAGRVALAKLARFIIRQRFMSDVSRANVEVIKEAIDGHRALTAGTFLFFALTPFASNFLFIAYGLTSAAVRIVALPFFIGRFVSYSFFVYAAGKLSLRLSLNHTDAKSYFGIYFVASQIVLMSAVYVLTRVDWRHVREQKRLRWLRTHTVQETTSREVL